MTVGSCDYSSTAIEKPQIQPNIYRFSSKFQLGMSKKPRPTVKLEHPTYGIKTEPLYQGYEERLVSWMEPDDVTSNEPKSTCQICDNPIDVYPNHLCKVCDRKFEFDQESNIQMKRKQMVVKYQCQECLKAFSNVNMYQRHVKCHDEKKPYRCGQCSMRFYHSKNLAEHMEMHGRWSLWLELEMKKINICHCTLHK